MRRAACYDVPAWHRMLLDEQAVPACPVGDAKVAGFGDAYVPELFHRLYAETPAEVPAAERSRAAALRGRLHDLAGELPEFAQLRRQTVRDPRWAGLATATLAETVAAGLPARRTPPTPDADRAQRLLDGLRDLGVAGTDLAAAEGAAVGAAFATAEAANDVDESAVRRALRAGCVAAGEAIDDARDACAAFGLGAGAGAGGVGGAEAALALARRVRSSEKLARIVALAGRLQATARAKRATRSEYARSELVGVEQTGDLGCILPSEMGALASPLRTADLVRRLGERAALGYRMRGREREAKGPILVCLDASGSMHGEKDVWAKAVALALMDIARTERRAFGICLFSDGVGASVLVPDPARAPAAELLDLMDTMPAGGTNFGAPIAWAIARLEDAAARGAFRRADVVLVTDGVAGTADAPAARARMDAIGAHVFGIAIGTSDRALATWAHSVASVDDVEHDAKATNLLFEGI